MLLGFRRRFADYILEGSKTHTIRGKRKRAPRVGELCHCYVDPRQKTMRLLGRWPCVQIQDIWIAGDGTPAGTRVITERSQLEPDECDLLAYLDGFRPLDASIAAPGPAFGLMLEFWEGRLPFHGDVIHWDYSRPVSS